MVMSRLPCLSVLLSALLSVLLPAPLAVAQEDMFAPAAQLKKYAPMAGSWEGSGVVRNAEGGQQTWTAKSSARWVLGRHVLREDVRIELGSAANPLEFHNLYGWDREYQRWVKIEVSNLGYTRTTEVYWTPDGTMITAGVSMTGGLPLVERWITVLGTGKTILVGNEAVGDRNFHEKVSGEMVRKSEKPGEVEIVDSAFEPDASAAAAEHMKRWAPVCGEYRMKGWWVPEPGAEKMEFTGRETLRPIFGGRLIEMVSVGDPQPGMPDYQGIAWIGWNDHDRCYVMTLANSMGEISSQECRFVGDKMVFTASHLYHGLPTCMRGVAELDEHGAFASYSAHALIGAQPPLEMFGATYEKTK